MRLRLRLSHASQAGSVGSTRKVKRASGLGDAGSTPRGSAVPGTEASRGEGGQSLIAPHTVSLDGSGSFGTETGRLGGGPSAFAERSPPTMRATTRVANTKRALARPQSAIAPVSGGCSQGVS